jgi:WD40 repeat protein
MSQSCSQSFGPAVMAKRPKRCTNWTNRLRLVCVALGAGWLMNGTAYSQQPKPDAKTVLSRLEISEDGTTAAFLDDHGLLKVKSKDSKETAVPLDSGKPQHVSAMALSPDGRMLVAAAPDGTITLWDLATRKVRTSYRLSDAQNIHSLVVLPPQGKVLAVAASDGVLKFVDLATGKLIREVRNGAKWTGLSRCPQTELYWHALPKIVNCRYGTCGRLTHWANWT